MDDKLYIGKKSIAQMMGISVITVQSMIEKHGLPAFQEVKGGTYFMRHRSYVEWMEKFEEKLSNK